MIWAKLQSGEIRYSDPARQGQTNEPIIQFDICFYGNLHCLLRNVDLCLKLLYHIVAGQFTWVETCLVKQLMGVAKTEVIKHSMKLQLFFLICQHLKVATQTLAIWQSSFFSVDYLHKICAVIHNTEHKENFSLLL